MLKPTHSLLPNQVQFIVSPQMTKFDVRQYLEKIYKVPVVDVQVYNHIGKSYPWCFLLFFSFCNQTLYCMLLLFTGKTNTTGRGYIVKKEDDKIAFVTLVTV